MSQHSEPGKDGPNADPPTTPLDPITVARATDDAFSRLVHEIASLVDGSLRYLNLAQRDLEERDQAWPQTPSMSYLDSANDALSRIASLVSDASGSVSRYSSITVGRRLSIGRSVRDIIEHAAAVVRPLAEEHAISLDVTIDPTTDQVERLPLYPVIVNALKNAIEACSANDHVTLTARAFPDEGKDATLEIEVSDTGRGLTEPAERLFEAGFSTKPGNTGFGLPIARDIVEELGGQISIEPNSRTRGTLLRIRLPIHAQGAEA